MSASSIATLDLPPPRTRDPLLQPLQIKHLVLRNRIMSTSHASALDVGGMPLERYQRYHEEKAKGGIALTMFGGSSMVYPAQVRIRNFVGFMIRKLSVTSSHQTFQFFGTSSRKKSNIAMLKSLKLA